jgi:hypothetical protein
VSSREFEFAASQSVKLVRRGSKFKIAKIGHQAGAECSTPRYPCCHTQLTSKCIK